MTAARTIRLIRVPTLRALQRSLAALVSSLTPAAARATAVLLPTAAAAEQLRRTIERAVLGATRPPASDFAQLGLTPAQLPSVICWPDLVTRGAWYARLHARLPGAPPLLDAFDRETLMRAAARESVDAGAHPPFALRPGIVAEMLRFADTVRRLKRSVDDVERVLCGTLEHEADSDRGAERLLAQTRFLVTAVRAFERRCAAVDGLDEHGVRARAATDALSRPYRRVVITTGDITSDVAGLWPADFELLARMPSLECIDVIVTEAVLACGLYERLEERLPGIEECRFDTFDPPPAIDAPESPSSPPYHVSRDREEELARIVRQLKWEASSENRDSGTGEVGNEARPDSWAVIVQRPLPYVYLARHTFEAAGVPWTASDTLPLAAEPYASAVDLVCDGALNEAARTSLIALCRCPHFRVIDERGGALDVLRDLDTVLDQAGFFGGFQRLREILASRVLEGEAATPGSSTARVGCAAARVQEVVSSLESLSQPARISEHTSALVALLDRYEAPSAGHQQASSERHLRARAAIRSAIERLGDASRAFDDPVVPFRETVAMLRRWIEARTFEPRVGEAGVHLLDAVSARYADVDVATIVGLVDGEWPEPNRRDIFYPPSLLADLGWPNDSQRRLASRAAFSDLLRLPRERVMVSTFTLEDDAIVQPAVLLEEIEGAGLPVVRRGPAPAVRVFANEAIALEPVVGPGHGPVADWVALRAGRPDAADPRYHGTVGSFARARHAVTQVDTYLDCPFRYFAERVLRLEDEREEDPGLTPRERGELSHAIFQRFFQRWSAAGRGAITEDNLADARRELAAVTEAALADLDDADAAIERAKLLGSAVSPAMGDRVLRHELDRGTEVVDRRLEETLDGTYVFTDAEGRERTVAIRGKADRIDFLSDGSMDLIDYKTGRAPETRAVQLPVYAHVAEQRFAGHREQQWRTRAADYLAFRGRVVTHALGRNHAERAARLEAAQQQFLAAVDGIAAGEFAPRPAEIRLCTWCPYGRVCRKDYADDADA
jgi:RecB family exonuclease